MDLAGYQVRRNMNQVLLIFKTPALRDDYAFYLIDMQIRFWNDYSNEIPAHLPLILVLIDTYIHMIIACTLQLKKTLP